MRYPLLQRQGTLGCVVSRPCLTCGDIIPTGTHCDQHGPPKYRDKLAERARSKVRRQRRDHPHSAPKSWIKLARKVKSMQPFCLDCSDTEDLTVDHIIPLSEDMSLAYTMANLTVRCRSCNSQRGNRCTDKEREGVLKAIESDRDRRRSLTQRQTRPGSSALS